MLWKYFIDANMLDPKYTLEIPCPHCGSEHTDNKFFLNGFCHKTCTKCKWAIHSAIEPYVQAGGYFYHKVCYKK